MFHAFVVVSAILALCAVVVALGVVLSLYLKPVVQRWKESSAGRAHRGAQMAPIGTLRLPRHRGASWQSLYDRFVPAEGQATTIQGELLRSITRVASEFSRNGCQNWCPTHIRMCDFIRQHLTDGTFGPEVNDLVNTRLQCLLVWAEPPRSDEETSDFATDTASDTDAPSLEPQDIEALECLSELWCNAHPEPILRSPDPALEF